jgi:hypothetical protein
MLFPLELWHDPIQHMADDTASLQTCALLCQGILPFVREQLFRSVNVGSL